MQLSEFRDTLDELCNTNSRTRKKDIVRGVQDCPAAITFLSGSEYDDCGLGKTTVLSVARDLFGEHIDGRPTVSESLDGESTGHGSDKELSDLRADMDHLAALSGRDQQAYLLQMFEAYNSATVVAHAILDDLPTGVSDTTIANALGLRDSLPFYESVVPAASVPNPISEPIVHNAFSPMLAASESRGRPETPVVAQRKTDGIRCVIHCTPDNVRAFSRRQNEITESLPELQEIPFPDAELIIDTEVISENESYTETSERVGRDAANVERDVEMHFHAFDLVSYNGRRTFEQPYKERYGILKYIEELVGDERFHVLGLETDIERAKDRAVANEEEGIIVKGLDEPYEFGKRSDSWQKVKIDNETIDVRITGFVEGEGRLSGTLGKVEIESADGVPLGHSGSGFPDEVRDEIWNNKEDWLGEPIEIEARGLSSEHGNLRMPIYKRSRKNEGRADSFEKIQEIMKDI